MKRFVGIILAVILALGLAACGETESTAETEQKTEATESASASEPKESAAEPSGEPAEPSGESAEPSEESAEPSEESAEPVKQSAEPSAEPSVEPSEEPAPAEPPEPEETTTQQTVTLPSEDQVLGLGEEIIPLWGANAVEYNSGQIFLNVNQAVELATTLAYWGEKNDYDFESFYDDDPYPYYYVVYVIPESMVQSYMTRLFGGRYPLSDFSNTEHRSAFSDSVPGYENPSDGYVLRNDDGDFELYLIVGDFSRMGDNLSVESITSNGTNTCFAVIRFDNSDYGEENRVSHTMSFGLIEDLSAEYGWAVTSIFLN